MKLPKPVEKKHPVLGYGEIQVLLQKAQDAHGRDSDRALVLLLADVGLRIGEALALTVADLDFTTHRAHVWRTWTEADGKLFRYAEGQQRPPRAPLRFSGE